MARNGWDSRAYGPCKRKRFVFVMIATQTVNPLLTNTSRVDFLSSSEVYLGLWFPQIDAMEGECCGKHGDATHGFTGKG